jgi:hypothetical protein
VITKDEMANEKKLIADAGQMLGSSVDAANSDEVEGVTKSFKYDYHRGTCSIVVLFATRRTVVPHMFRAGLIEESTMGILEAVDLDPASQKPRVLSEPEEKWSGKTCAEKCLGKMTETI